MSRSKLPYSATPLSSHPPPQPQLASELFSFETFFLYKILTPNFYPVLHSIPSLLLYSAAECCYRRAPTGPPDPAGPLACRLLRPGRGCDPAGVPARPGGPGRAGQRQGQPARRPQPRAGQWRAGRGVGPGRLPLHQPGGRGRGGLHLQSHNRHTDKLLVSLKIFANKLCISSYL